MLRTRLLPICRFASWSTLCLVVTTAPLGAQSPPPWAESILNGGKEAPKGEDEAARQLTIAGRQAERDAIDDQIDALRRSALPTEGAPADAGAGQVPDAGLDALATEDAALAEASQLRRLERTRSLLGQQIDELERRDALARADREMEELEDRGVAALADHPPPFTFDDLDGVLARLEAARSRHSLLDDAVSAGVEALDEAERQLKQAEQSGRDGDSAAGAERDTRELALDAGLAIARLAREELAQLRLQQANDRQERDLEARRVDFLGRGALWMRGQLQPSPEALEARLDGLTADQAALRQQLADLRRESQREENRLLRAQEAGRGMDAEMSRTTLDLLDQRQRMLDDRIDRRDAAAELWRLRHGLAGEAKPSPQVRSQAETTIERDRIELERDRRLLSARLKDLRASRSAAGATPAGADDGTSRRRQQLFDQQIDFVEAQLADIESALALARRAEAEAKFDGLSVGEVTSGLWHRLVSVWQWEITVVDQRAITLGKVILALLLLIAGYLASKRVSGALGRALQRRFGLSSGAAAALQNIAFYLMVVAFLVWAMQLVSIPLTVFTFLGGVLAIGIGFGSQNVVNNFISGLILLVERPVKVGDLIEVDGTVGSVERIGLRSARIRSGDNTHIIVPNSVFLEQKVLNWTISDDLVRTDVDVGIAYGSPTRKAAELMKQALDEEELVESGRPKEILFLDFGDDALLFRAYFWVRVRAQLDKVRVQSAVRYRIEELLREADIVIAYPQRDVHLDTQSPLQVRLMTPPDAE